MQKIIKLKKKFLIDFRSYLRSPSSGLRRNRGNNIARNDRTQMTNNYRSSMGKKRVNYSLVFYVQQIIISYRTRVIRNPHDRFRRIGAYELSTRQPQDGTR